MLAVAQTVYVTARNAISQVKRRGEETLVAKKLTFSLLCVSPQSSTFHLVSKSTLQKVAISQALPPIRARLRHVNCDGFVFRGPV